MVLLTSYLLGVNRTKELMLSGELFDVREAQSMSSVNRVLPVDKVLAGRVPGEKGHWLPGAAVR